jgi:hypothetical protein
VLRRRSASDELAGSAFDKVGAREKNCRDGKATVPRQLVIRSEACCIAWADLNFAAPRVSVWEDRMHPWVGLPDGIEHIG